MMVSAGVLWPRHVMSSQSQSTHIFHREAYSSKQVTSICEVVHKILPVTELPFLKWRRNDFVIHFLENLCGRAGIPCRSARPAV